MAKRDRSARHLGRRLSNLQYLLFPLLGAFIRLWVRLNQRFVRYDCRGPLFDYIREGRPCVIALWHQDVFPLMFELFRYTRGYRCSFMVSPGRVGTIGTYLLNIWGIDCVSGSRHSGMAAVGELSRGAACEGYSIFIMADGSRGPAREARWGAIYLARNTGLPLIPVRAWGDNLVTLSSTWMKLVLPKPWGRAVLLSAQPLYVAGGEADRGVMENHRAELEKRLNILVADAEAYFVKGPEAVAAYGAPARLA